MLLSTSNFDHQLPNVAWRWVLSCALASGLALIIGMEYQLAALGYQPTVFDSPARWANERARASRLGTNALILIGASRIQLGVDLSVLRQATGLEPVQLAIDGTAVGAILAHLAADPSIRGTVLVDYYDHNIGVMDDAARLYLQAYAKLSAHNMLSSPAFTTEQWLTEFISEHMLSYADGATPMLSLLTRIAQGQRSQPFLATLPDRSRSADYSMVTMPKYYYTRVTRQLGLPDSALPANAEPFLVQQVEKLKPADSEAFFRRIQTLKPMVSAIQARGGRVVFVQMPSSGLVREIEARRYPPALFWDRFVAALAVPAVRVNDNPVFPDFNCPDGSHLNYTDRALFTRALVQVLGLAKP